MAEPIELFLIRIRKDAWSARRLVMLTNKFMDNYSASDQKKVKSFVSLLEEFADKLEKELDK